MKGLDQLPPTALHALASSLRQGALSAGITRHAVEQIAGSHTASVVSCLDELQKQGLTPGQAAIVVDAVAEARESSQGAGNLVELVLSGPELPGVPMRDTGAVMQMLTAAAQKEVLLVGYAVHNGRRIFEGLVARMRRVPALRVTFCLDIARPFNDTSLPSEIVRRFAHEFRTKHWPWPELPELYYDPRSVAEGTAERSSLHAKCVVIDSREALVTSANFTEAAQERNIEVGVLIRHAPQAQRIADYFRGLRATGQLVPCCIE